MKHTINQFIGSLPAKAKDYFSVKANLCVAKLSEARRNYKIIDRV
jgi:hypothetical protein